MILEISPRFFVEVRIEYERCVEQFTSAKAKLEEQKARGSKRTDEYKDKLVKVGSIYMDKDWLQLTFLG